MTRWLSLTSSVLMLALLAASPSSAAAGRTPAAETLARCVQDTGTLDVVLLVDESGSLASTDRGNRRVEGLRAALAGLGLLASTPVNEKEPELNVLFVGFAGSPSPVPGARDAAPAWTTLDRSRLGRLATKADEFATRNTGHYTDYYAALLAARRFLAERAGTQTQTGGKPPCKALIWFTDGRYDVAGGDRAVETGVAALCHPESGLMDGMASDGVVKFVVGLSLDGSAEAFLRSLADGTGSGCGRLVRPDTGTYINVRDSAGLFFAFGSLLDGEGSRLPSRVTCPGKPCAAGATSIVLKTGLRGFVLRAVTGAKGLTPVLTSPSGSTVAFRPGSSDAQTLDGATFSQQWASPNAVVIQASLDGGDPGWEGEWRLAFVAPSGSRTDTRSLARIQLLAAPAAELTGRPALVKGAQTSLQAQMTDADGRPSGSSDVASSATVAAKVSSTSGQEMSSVNVLPTGTVGRYRLETTLGADVAAPALFLDITTSYAPIGGLAVRPEQRSVRLPTKFPDGSGYPTVTPDELHPPSIEGAGATNAKVTVTASPDAAGCVWIGELARADDLAVAVTPDSHTDADSCLHLDRGEQRSFDVELAVRESSSRTAHLEIPIHLTSALSQEARTVNLPVSVQLYPPTNVGKRWAIIGALTAAGALLPLLLLWLLNFWTARLAAPQLLRSLTQEVRINQVDGAVTAIGGGAPKTGYADFEPVSSEGYARRPKRLTISIYDIAAVAARRPTDLLRGPSAVASAPQSFLVGAGAAASAPSGDAATSQAIPLALAGTWLFTPTAINISPVDPTSHDEIRATTTVDGELTMIISDGGDIDAGTHTVELARAALAAREWDSVAPAAPASRIAILLDRLRPSRNREDLSDARDWQPSSSGHHSQTEIDDDPHSY